MERTKVNPFKKADGILVSDMHIREDQPVCRTDDFQAAMWRKIDFISALQKKHGCAVYNAGDLFNHWKPSPDLLTKASQHIPDKFISVYGQHDLPQHSLDLAHKSGLYNLMTNGKVAILQNGNWGQSLDDGRTGFIISGRQLTIQHVYTYQGKTWPGNTSPKAAKLLRKYPQFSLILTGDNHQSFVEEYEGRLLVNPGSLMRSTADQIDHKPRVYLWYADTNTVEAVYLPIEKDVISRDHIEEKQQRDSRIDSFVERLDGSWEVGLTFEENIEAFEKSNDIRKSVMDIIYKAMEE